MSGPNVRSVYLITYSQANEEWTRQSFADSVVGSFETHDAVVKHWACCKESHEDGGIHFHIAVKLDRQKRWLRIRNFIADQHGINVNFSDTHSNYFNAWEYVVKEDAEYLQSDGHPDLSAGFVPRTTNATVSRRASTSATPERATSSSRKRKFDALDMSDVIVQKKIHTKEELLILVNEQKLEGKRDLALYVLNNIDRCVKLISTTWEMVNAQEFLTRKTKSRMELLREASLKECNCDGEWLSLALETLDRNGFRVGEFSSAVRSLLNLGRGKHRNILLTGPANCGKSFLLNPLTEVYKCFTNPAQNSFAWIGAEKAEVIYLNDLRWADKLIPWNNFLQLLEGAEVHLSAPKNHSPEDIKFTADTPIFATSIAPIRKYTAGVVNEGETEMMACRWNHFKFTRQLEKHEVKEVSPCATCFSKLIIFH